MGILNNVMYEIITNSPDQTNRENIGFVFHETPVPSSGEGKYVRDY